MVKKWTLLFRTDVGVRIVKKPDTHTYVHRHGHERGHPHAHFESAVTVLPLYVYGEPDLLLFGVPDHARKLFRRKYVILQKSESFVARGLPRAYLS